MSLSAIDRKLLIALRTGSHFKDNPGSPAEILGLEFRETEASARRLIELGLARRVTNSAKPGVTYLRISDSGMSEADILMQPESNGSSGNGSKTHPAIINNVTVNPVFNNSTSSNLGQQPGASNGANWFSAWGQWVAAIAAIAGLAWTLHAAKVF